MNSYEYLCYFILIKLNLFIFRISISNLKAITFCWILQSFFSTSKSFYNKSQNEFSSIKNKYLNISFKIGLMSVSFFQLTL